MKKYLIGILVAMMLALVPATGVLAATTADVTITFTPATVAIADDKTSYDFGYVNDSDTPSTTTSYVTIDNTSNIQTDITIAVTGNTWTGGNAFTHSDTATPGADTVGLKTNRGGTWGVSDIIVKYSSPNYIYENCPANTDFSYGLKLYAQTSHSDSVQKTNTVRVSAAAG